MSTSHQFCFSSEKASSQHFSHNLSGSEFNLSKAKKIILLILETLHFRSLFSLLLEHIWKVLGRDINLGKNKPFERMLLELLKFRNLLSLKLCLKLIKMLRNKEPKENKKNDIWIDHCNLTLHFYIMRN